MADIGLYKVFYAVAKTGSLTNAAKMLFISQPAVSQAIKQLETQLGGRLFIRTPRGMKLTESIGETMYGYVEKAMDLIKAAENRFYQLKNLAIGTLHIAASDTIIKYLLLYKIRCFHDLYPQIKLQITNCTSMESLELLKTGSADIAFVNLPIHDDSVAVRECSEIHDCFVADYRQSALAESVQPLSFIKDYPLIMLSSNSNSRKSVTDFCSLHGVDLAPDIELGSLELLSDFAMSGMGIACVTREYVTEALENNKLFEIKTEPALPCRRIGLLTVKNIPLSYAVKEFVNLFPRLE